MTSEDATRSGNVEGDEDTIDTNYDFLIKFLLLGDSGVGKTCFLHRYTAGEFKPTFMATVGVDFRLKKLEYEFPEDDESDSKKKIHLQLWDTAGQERYRSLTKAFFRDGMGFLLLFDLTNEKSFQSVREWLNEIREQAYCENPDVILIGNKTDLENVEVKTAQAKQLADQLGIFYIETSAATGENVNEAIKKLLDMVMKRMKEYVSAIDTEEPQTPLPSSSSHSQARQDVNKLVENNKDKSSKCPC